MNVHPISHSIAYVDCTKSGGSKKQKKEKEKKNKPMAQNWYGLWAQ